MHYSQFYYDETRAASIYSTPRFEHSIGQESEIKVEVEVIETVKFSRVLIAVLSLGLSAVFFTNNLEAKTPTEIQTNLEK